MESNEKTKAQGRQENLECKFKNMKKLKEDLNSLLCVGKNSDVVFNVEGREIKAHKSILSARSDYFSAMFDHDMFEKHAGVVTIEDCDTDAFQCLLQYIYTGDMNFSPGSIANLYNIADRYQVLELKEKCENRIESNLSIDNFCDIVRLSLLHPELNLKETMRQYFSKNASPIVSTSKWVTLMQENPTVCNELFCETLKWQ